MAKEATIQQVIDLSAGKANEQKLRQITQRLEEAYGGRLINQPLLDPIIVRRKLVGQLKNEGASAGTIQALEQCFMGIVRRAAVEGIIPAPPEGPWTRAWQAVLTSTVRLRSQIRLLAAWATDRGLEPNDINIMQLNEWAIKSGCDAETLSDLQSILSIVPELTGNTILESTTVLTQRLKMKAIHGSVRSGHE